MSENQEPSSEMQEAIDDVDFLLRMLVMVANKLDAPMGITLQVGGGFISGMLISEKSYYEQFAKDFDRMMSEAPDFARSMFQEELFQPLIAHQARLHESHADEEDEPEALRPQYVHMNMAQYFVPGQRPLPDEGMLWRGRLSAVQGFTLGLMNATMSRTR